MTFLTDLAQHLENIGLGNYTEPNPTIFVAYAPAKLASLVALFETVGPPPDVDIPTINPTFQVFIRDTKYALGKTKMDAIFNALHRIQNQTIGNSFFYNITAVSQGGHIGRNESGQDEFSINFKCFMRGGGQ